MRRALPAVAIAVVLTVPGVAVRAAPSNLQALRPGSFEVSPLTLVPAGRLSLSGAGCPGGTTVRVVTRGRGAAAGDRIASLPVRPDGSFQGAARLPSGVGLGTHTIDAVCDGQTVGSATIRVVILGFLELDGAHGPLTLSRSAVPAGSRLSIFAQPCRAGAAGAALNDTPLKLAAPARTGAVVKAGVTIPSDTPPGLYTLSSRCGGRVAGAAALRVLSAGRSPPAVQGGGGLPLRRINLLLLAVACTILVMVGYLTVMAVGRHRNRTATPGYFDLPSSQRPMR